MSEAVTERLVESNPCTVRGAAGKPAPVHRAEALSMPELRAYYDALDKEHRLPLMLAALCGLRSGMESASARCTGAGLPAVPLTVHGFASMSRSLTASDMTDRSRL